MRNFLLFCTLLATSLSLAGLSDGAEDKTVLAFRVYGRNLAKGLIGKSDPYYTVYLSEDGGKTKRKLGRSDIVQNDQNPDWLSEFEITFDRKKKQFLQFKVKDADRITRDDNLGSVWIDVADYVDHQQFATPELNNKPGHLIIKKVNDTHDFPGEEIKFKLSAKNLPKQTIAFIPVRGDPYVMLAYADSAAASRRYLGRTGTMKNTQNPKWNDVVTFQWDKNKDQVIHFTIYDHDKVGKDDEIGDAWVMISDYVAEGQKSTLLLSNGGSLTMQKAV